MIRFNCKHCGKLIAAPEKAIGRRRPCPECKQPIDVPRQSTPMPDSAQEYVQELAEHQAIVPPVPGMDNQDVPELEDWMPQKAKAAEPVPEVDAATAMSGALGDDAAEQPEAFLADLDNVEGQRAPAATGQVLVAGAAKPKPKQIPWPLIGGVVGGVAAILLVAVLISMFAGPRVDPWLAKNLPKFEALHKEGQEAMAAKNPQKAMEAWIQILTATEAGGQPSAQDRKVMALVSEARQGYDLARAQVAEVANKDEFATQRATALAKAKGKQFVEAQARLEVVLGKLSELRIKTPAQQAMEQEVQGELDQVHTQWAAQSSRELDAILADAKAGTAENRFDEGRKRVEAFEKKLETSKLPAPVVAKMKGRAEEFRNNLATAEQDSKIAMAKAADEAAKKAAVVEAAANAPVVITAANAPEHFAKAFGADIEAAAATPGKADDALLAERFLAVLTVDTPEPYILFVLRKTAEFGAMEISGYRYAVQAHRRLQTFEPDKALAHRQTAADLGLILYEKVGPGAPKAGELVEAFLRLGANYLDLDDADKAVVAFQKSKDLSKFITGAPAKMINDGLATAKALQASQGRIAELKKKVDANPEDQDALRQLVTIYMVDADRPSAAKPYAEKLADAALKSIVLWAAAPVAGLAKEPMVELIRWYADKGSDANVANRVGMLMRSRFYYEEYIIRFKVEDELTKQKLAEMKKKADEALEKEGVGMKAAQRAVKQMAAKAVGEDPRIKQAIAKAVANLYNQHDPDKQWELYDRAPEDARHAGGMTSLVAYSLMMAGEDPQTNAKLRGAIQWVFSQPMGQTYAVCFRVHLWETLPDLDTDLQKKSVVRKDVKGLWDSQNTDGAIHYVLGHPNKKIDLSTSLAGWLCFWLAETNGLEVPGAVNGYARVCRTLAAKQTSDGGWAYDSTDPNSKVNCGMTCAGMTILLMAKERGHLRKLDDVRAKADAAIEKGLKWLDENFNPKTTPGGGYYYYQMAAVQHVGLLSGRAKFGAHDWYKDVADHLIKTQKEDGSWTANIHDTAFALTFLARGGNRYDVRETSESGAK